MQLDFSKLENIAYRGFGELAVAEKDALTDEGFIVIEGEKTPFETPPAREAETSTNPSISAVEPPERAYSRDYKSMYRAAWNLHERHNPPIVDIEYWKSHSPGIDETPQAELDYWERAVEDIAVTAGGFSNDPFITGLLSSILEELERSYKELKDAAQDK